MKRGDTLNKILKYTLVGVLCIFIFFITSFFKSLIVSKNNSNINNTVTNDTVYAGIILELSELLKESQYVSYVSEDYIPDTYEDYKEYLAEEYREEADTYIESLFGTEKDINRIIYEIRESDFLNDQEKVKSIAMLLAERGNIKYETNGNLFNWNNELLDDDFLQPGHYYETGMSFDCSGFVQYLIWISTGNSHHDGILIGRATYFSSIEGNNINSPTMGTLCFHYNGGSGVERNGEVMTENETPTSESNHVAVYLGDNLYAECSSSYGGVRIKDITDNEFYETFYTWYRDVLSLDYGYKTQLESQLYWEESEET